MIYVLQLEDNCFYVGYTINIKHRIRMHFSGKGSTWTKLHKPIKVIEILEGNKNTEKIKTLEYMETYGYKNVRGYAWTQVNLNKEPIKNK